MLIITPANLFCSLLIQMNINATEDDSRARVLHEHTQTDADRQRKKKFERKTWTRKDEHAFRVSPSETVELGSARAFFITAAEGRMGKRASFK